METKVEKELALRDLLQIYHRRRMIIYGVLITCCILAGIYCTVCTRRYKATGVIQVQKEGADAMGLEDLMSGSGSGGDSNPLQANTELQTQAQILQSETLAVHTVQSLNMENNYDFRPHRNGLTWFLGMFSSNPVPDPKGTSLEDSPRRRQNAVRVFSKNLEVTPITGTRLIEIDYTNPDPKLAADVINTLIRSLADYTFQTRYDATNQASKWLSDQLGDLRKESEDLQERVVDLQRESGVYSLGTVDAQGQEQAYSGVLDKLQQATTAMNLAAQNSILKGAISKAAETGNAELLSGLAGNLGGGTSQATSSSLNLIQNLRAQEATQQAALRQAESQYGPAYPAIEGLKGSIAGIERSIQQETDRLKGRAKSDYDIAMQTQAESKRIYDEDKRQADILNNKAIQYAIVREEAEQSRNLYEDLLKRLKEAGIVEGLHSSNITVVDPGRVPARPSKPNVPIYMAIAIVAGFFLGCCAALVIDTLDNKVSGVADTEQVMGQDVLGVLPYATELPGIRGEKPLNKGYSVYIEAMRALRTSLMLWQSNAPPKVLLVTSSIAGEGKSTTSMHLAAVLAQYGQRVLLVDADLRRGLLRKRLNLAPGPGLSAMISGQWTGAEIPHLEGTANLDVLQAGLAPPNPSELLGSEAMRACIAKWRTEYDFVVLDGPPVLPVTDGVLLSAQVDATLLVTRAGMTEKPQLQRSFRILHRDGGHLVGVVLNGLRPDDQSYYGYYGYHRYDNSYAEGSDA